MRIVLRSTALLVLVSSSFFLSAFGQSPMPVSATKEVTLPPPAPAGATSLVPQKVASAVVEVPTDTPIVTLQGVCDGAPASKTAATKSSAAKNAAKSCKTVITKAQMDALLDALMPNATPDSRRQFALNYIRMLAASGVATEKNLWKDPAVAKELEARVEFTRMQVMAGSLYHRVEKLAEDVQESEIKSYYDDHAATYTQGEVQRITVMKAAVAGTPLDPAMLRTKAEELRARAVKGEDFDQLQKEAVQAFNPGGTVPPTKVATTRRSGLLATEGVVFDLKPGEVTPLVESQGAFEILKLVSRQAVPLESVRAEIKSGLTNGHLQLIMKDATKGVTANFNLAYLGLSSTPELFLSPSLRPPTKPGTGSGVNPGMDPRMAGGRPGSGGMQRRHTVAMPAPQSMPQR